MIYYKKMIYIYNIFYKKIFKLVCSAHDYYSRLLTYYK